MDKVKHDSPAKQGETFDSNDPKQMEELKKVPKSTKTYPKSYTKKDIEFLKEQREDVVRYEDLDEKGKEIWRKQGKPVPPPTKQKQQSSGVEKVQKMQTSKAAQLLRQKQIDAVDAKIEALEEDRFNEKITQEQYDEAMKSIRVKEKQVKKPL